MARDLHGSLRQHQHELRDEFPWVWLYELEVPSSPDKTRYRITNYTSAIEFGTNTAGEPLVYSPYPVTHGVITQTRQGDLPTLRVSIQNAAKEIGLTVDQYDGMIGQRAVVRLINLETIDEPTAQVRWDAEVKSVSVRAEVITFDLASYNIYRSKFQRWRYLTQHCNFRFGGPECGYIPVSGATNTVGGGFDFCQKQYTACVERGADEDSRGVDVRHPMRYGGFRGIPG